MNFRVTCINKPHRNSPHESILRLGGINSQGEFWNDSKVNVITYIENNPKDYFYTESNGNIAYVGVVREDGNKAPYLRTYADDSWNNNLLSLLECVY